MNHYKLRKGLDLRLVGEPEARLLPSPAITDYALRPDDFGGMKPRLLVAVGDHVKVGSALFQNKTAEDELFVSPVSGEVTAIERGERRKILYVSIKADAEQQAEVFETPNENCSAEQMVALLARTGMLAFIKQRPYDITATPEALPRGIFCSAFNSMPLSADFSFVVKGQEADFQAGISALSRIAPVWVSLSKQQAEAGVLADLRDATLSVFSGPNPAGNVGVQINHIAPISKGEVVWTIGAEEVLFVGRLMRQGRVDLTRTVAIAGSEVKQPAYMRLKVGARLAAVCDDVLKQTAHVRLIQGNPLVGSFTHKDDFLGAHATGLVALPAGDDCHELLGWMRPRLRQFSASHAYFSWLQPGKRYDLDTRIKGGQRHMIMSGEYERVFPMDILPEQLIKAILAGDIDLMEQLGIYEVAPEDFALAEFVDSSKLELQRIVREGLDFLRKEME